MLFFDKFENRYILKGILEAVSPLHIGASKERFDPLEVDNGIVRYQSDNSPFIPGSSLKGVLRTYIETILSTGMIKDRDGKAFKSCFVTTDSCYSKYKEEIKKLKEQKNKEPEEYAKKIYELMCDTCRLFGSQEMASKIYIQDLKVIGDYKVSVRDGVGIDRDTGTAADRVKYNFEVVEPGARFELCMTFENIEERYEPIINLLVNALKNGNIKIGGKTSRGLGAVKLVDWEIYKIDKANLPFFVEKGLTSDMIWRR